MNAGDIQQTVHLVQETNIWATISYIVAAVVGVVGIIISLWKTTKNLLKSRKRQK